MSRKVALASALLVAALSPVARAQVKLEPKFVEGSKQVIDIVTKTHQILTIAGMDVETSAEQEITSTSAVGTRMPDGTLPLVQTIDALKVEMTLPGGMGLSFDSANPPTQKDTSPVGFLRDAVQALAGSSYTIHLDARDKFVSVEGTQAVIDRAADLDPKAADHLKTQLNPETIGREFEQEFEFLPSILVREGDPWEHTQISSIGGGQTLTFAKRYTYEGTVDRDGRTLDKIGVKATEVTYAMDPQAESPVRVDKSDLKIESSEGTILFDRQAGRTVASDAKTRITGDMTLRINETDLPSKLDLTLETHSRVRD